jgi:C-terminal processing protease CtpA/Prc
MARPIPVDIFDATELTEAAWDRMRAARVGLGDPERRVLRVDEFQASIAQAPGTTRAEREQIVRQARVLLTELYPHLPFKIEKHQIDHPGVELDRIEREIDRFNETQFHQAMIGIFADMHDAHTVYGTPPPFRGTVAFLPFQIRHVHIGKFPRFLVTGVMHSPLGSGFDAVGFGRGAEIVQWGALSIRDHVKRVGWRSSAANEDAILARGAMHCTLRPLTFSKYPFVDELPEAVVLYAAQDDTHDVRAIKLPWGFLPGIDALSTVTRSLFSVSPVDRGLNTANQYIHQYEDAAKDQVMKAANDLNQVSLLPTTFEFQLSSAFRQFPLIRFGAAARGRKLGYLRIRRFGDGTDDREATARILVEFRRILRIMDTHAPDGLVLDIRSNPGGDVVAAERMLQMLTPERIEPEPFHLANTSAVLGTLNNVRTAGREALTPAEGVSLSRARQALRIWLDLAPPSAMERVTAGRRITEEADANSIGQIYTGPVALLIDALTFSAADIFAAGFQDHEIGPVFGIHGRTGGGGGTFSTLESLRGLLGPRPAVGLEALPHGVTMSLAFHRCARVGPNAAKWLEDDGVEAAVVGSWKFEDVVDNFPNAVPSIFERLVKLPRRRFDVTGFSRVEGGGSSVELREEGLDFLRFFLDGRFALELDVRRFRSGAVAVPPVAGIRAPQSLTIAGFTLAKRADEKPKIRALRRFAFEQPQAAPVRAAAPAIRSITQFNPITGRRR